MAARVRSRLALRTSRSEGAQGADGVKITKEKTPMKKLIPVLWLFLLASFTYGQEIKKGALIGVHTFDDVKLAPGVTMEQFVNAFNTKMIPALEKARKGWKCYPIKRIRGEKSATYGVIMVIPSEKERDIYFKPDGSDSELGKTANKIIEPALSEVTKLGTMPADRFIDWLVY